jgi:hypothetical protein
MALVAAKSVIGSPSVDERTGALLICFMLKAFIVVSDIQNPVQRFGAAFWAGL